MTTKSGSRSIAWTIIAIVAIILAIYYQMVQTPTMVQRINEFDDRYDRLNISTPMLQGATLKIIRTIMELPVIGILWRRFIYSSNNFNVVRDFGHQLQTIPSYIPRRLLQDNEYHQHLKMSQNNDYKSVLNVSIQQINSILGPNKNPSELITVEKIIESYLSKRKTPIDIAKQALDAANKLSKLNIFTQLNEQDVMNQAKQSTQRWKNNQMLSILDGVPIAIKDNLPVIGYNTTDGTSFMGQMYGISSTDHIVVARLRKLGAIIFGKTNLYEIGIGASGLNIHFGTSRNPYSYNLLHDTGGSSGGSAAAVSSGIVPLAIGTDGGGSVRIPSSFCGLFGLKSTYGRVPFLPRSAGWSNTHIGFLSNNLRDQAIGYMAIAGYNKSIHGVDSGDYIMNSNIAATNPPVHLYGYNKIDSLKKLNIGIFWDWFNDADVVMRNECLKVVNILCKKYGANLVNVTIPHLSIVNKAFGIIILSEWLQGDHEYINKYSDSTVMSLLFAKQFDVVDLLSAMKIRNWMLQYFDDVIFGEQSIDILITPTTSITAPKYKSVDSSIVDQQTTVKVTRFSTLGNFIGIPAMAVPIGYKKYNNSFLPMSMQLMANHWNEHKLFRVANLVEQNVLKRKIPPTTNMFEYKL